MDDTPSWPLWTTGQDGRGLHLVEAGPRIWIGQEMLDDLLWCMPRFPVALEGADFSACPAGCYRPAEGAVGTILRFRLTDGRRAVYRIVRFDFPRDSYEAQWTE
jgi:hypothetical protein